METQELSFRSSVFLGAAVLAAEPCAVVAERTLAVDAARCRFAVAEEGDVMNNRHRILAKLFMQIAQGSPLRGYVLGEDLKAWIRRTGKPYTT